jgi:hypothetical protein
VKKFLQFLLASLLAVAGFTVVSTTAAQAHPACGFGYICFFDGQDGTSLIAKEPWTDWSANMCYTMGGGNNRISYIVNDSGHDFIVSTIYDCSGTTAKIYAYSYGPMTGVWNNSISSIYRID